RCSCSRSRVRLTRWTIGPAVPVVTGLAIRADVSKARTDLLEHRATVVMDGPSAAGSLDWRSTGQTRLSLSGKGQHRGAAALTARGQVVHVLVSRTSTCLVNRRDSQWPRALHARGYAPPGHHPPSPH